MVFERERKRLVRLRDSLSGREGKESLYPSFGNSSLYLKVKNNGVSESSVHLSPSMQLLLSSKTCRSYREKHKVCPWGGTVPCTIQG